MSGSETVGRGGNKEIGRNREERREHMKRERGDGDVQRDGAKEKNEQIEGKRRKGDRERERKGECVKVEASSLGYLLFSLTFLCSALIHFYLFTSLKSSCLHKLLLPFPCCLTLCCFSSFFPLFLCLFPAGWKSARLAHRRQPLLIPSQSTLATLGI